MTVHQPPDFVSNDVDGIIAYDEDRRNVLDDPDRFGVAAIVAFLHFSPEVSVDEILTRQLFLHMSLQKEAIERIADDLACRGYFEPQKGGFVATRKLMIALERDGVTKERLVRLGRALTH